MAFSIFAPLEANRLVEHLDRYADWV